MSTNRSDFIRTTAATVAGIGITQLALPPTLEACAAGKHVYVKKPLANSIGEINVRVTNIGNFLLLL